MEEAVEGELYDLLKDEFSPALTPESDIQVYIQKGANRAVRLADEFRRAQVCVWVGGWVCRYSMLCLYLHRICFACV